MPTGSSKITGKILKTDMKRRTFDASKIKTDSTKIATPTTKRHCLWRWRITPDIFVGLDTSWEQLSFNGKLICLVEYLINLFWIVDNHIEQNPKNNRTIRKY